MLVPFSNHNAAVTITYGKCVVITLSGKQDIFIIYSYQDKCDIFTLCIVGVDVVLLTQFSHNIEAVSYIVYLIILLAHMARVNEGFI